MSSRKITTVESIEAKRKKLRSHDDVRFIDRGEFCRLLISANSLNRCDIPQARVRGIYAPSLGLHYLIEEEALFHQG